MKTKFGTLVLLGGLSLTAAAQNPTAVADIYSRTDFTRTEGGITVAANAYSWHQGGASSELTSLPAIMASLNPEDIHVLVEGVSMDFDGVNIGWNSADKKLTIDCAAGNQGRLEARVFNLDGVQLAFESLNESTTTISLSDLVPDYYLVAITEDGKLLKTIKLHLK